MNVDVSKYGAKCDGSDSVPALKNAIEELKAAKGAKRLVFPKGRYEFWPELAEEDFLFTSNNDAGLKRIAFNIKEF